MRVGTARRAPRSAPADGPAHTVSPRRATPGVCGLRLYVETDNVAAQRTYARCGMVDAQYRVMEVDYSAGPRRDTREE